jgi:hypothetical protein
MSSTPSRFDAVEPHVVFAHRLNQACSVPVMLRLSISPLSAKISGHQSQGSCHARGSPSDVVRKATRFAANKNQIKQLRSNERSTWPIERVCCGRPNCTQARQSAVLNI